MYALLPPTLDLSARPHTFTTPTVLVVLQGSSAALWQWEAVSFQQLVTNEQVACRPLMWAGLHKVASADGDVDEEEALFTFR